jgi:FKBP-type peptidyl-prolyl cis-trans isomerase
MLPPQVHQEEFMSRAFAGSRPVAGLIAVGLLLGGAGALTGCAGDENSSSPTPSATSSKAVVAAPVVIKGSKFGENPTIAKPKGKPPTTLVVKDLIVGKGGAVTDDTTAYNWNYEGISWSNGTVFDSSFDRGAPIPFSLNQVIQGWRDGLKGMKIGGRRELVIPPDQAYGEAGSPPSIGPNETLVFVVDLVSESSQ